MIIIWYLISSIFTFLYGYMLFYKKKYHYLLHGFLVFVISYYFTVFFYFLFLRYIISNPYFVFWITYVFIFLIAGTYHFSSIEFSKRTSVALLGGFLITKSLGNIIGGFPSETLVITLLENMEYKQLSFKLNNFIYIYLGGWMIIFVTSQVFYNTKKSEIYDTSLEENAINHILVIDEN